ncbi:hypothetical protein [Actinomycetospora flava]|uniref:Uncharacterized protein n=1 Tax=Actinomycetospora flava TaxID=3129232 RepID=A0ABU8M954_9PSEU
MNPDKVVIRRLWVLISVLFSIIAGMVGGILAAATGSTVAQAFVAGAATFAGSVAVTLGLLSALGLLKDTEPR